MTSKLSGNGCDTSQQSFVNALTSFSIPLLRLALCTAVPCWTLKWRLILFRCEPNMVQWDTDRVRKMFKELFYVLISWTLDLKVGLTKGSTGMCKLSIRMDNGNAIQNNKTERFPQSHERKLSSVFHIFQWLFSFPFSNSTLGKIRNGGRSLQHETKIFVLEHVQGPNLFSLQQLLVYCILRRKTWSQIVSHLV